MKQPETEAPETHYAVVRYNGLQVRIEEGESVVVGRRSTCDVRVGSPEPGPEDLGISRRAATVSLAQGRMWVTNDSTSQAVTVCPATGATHILDGRGDTVSLTDAELDLIIEGRVLTYRISIERSYVPKPDVEDEPPTEAPPTQSALPLSERERRVLTAICEPLLVSSTRNGRPATYGEASARLHLAKHTVKNQMDALREKLICLGVPGISGADAKDALARYAVRCGSVTRADLGLLDPGSDQA